MHRRLLLVAGEPGTRSDMGHVLSDGGWVVDTAPGGDEALALLRRCSYAAIVLDYQLPGMAGFALARSFAAILRTLGRDTPLVALADGSRALILHRGRDAAFAAAISRDDAPSRIRAILDDVATRHPGEADMSLTAEEARAAAVAIWAARGIRGLPRAYPLPAPFAERREALSLCFDLVEPEAAACVLLLERHGLRLIPEAARGLPIVALSDDLADVADALFAIDDEESWGRLASLLGASQPPADSHVDHRRQPVLRLVHADQLVAAILSSFAQSIGHAVDARDVTREPLDLAGVREGVILVDIPSDATARRAVLASVAMSRPGLAPLIALAAPNAPLSEGDAGLFTAVCDRPRHPRDLQALVEGLAALESPTVDPSLLDRGVLDDLVRTLGAATVDRLLGQLQALVEDRLAAEAEDLPRVVTCVGTAARMLGLETLSLHCSAIEQRVAGEDEVCSVLLSDIHRVAGLSIRAARALSLVA
ncbi:response regulator [uncultured Alsobacter sp.]|uniref:response regulator n=1 Tax=uncultured Alsobacter sp. TaxID=1748258 RepID=UPI0025EABB4F|nr:response regulator [uncultured Alsobacter sp.]